MRYDDAEKEREREIRERERVIINDRQILICCRENIYTVLCRKLL